MGDEDEDTDDREFVCGDDEVDFMSDGAPEYDVLAGRRRIARKRKQACEDSDDELQAVDEHEVDDKTKETDVGATTQIRTRRARKRLRVVHDDLSPLPPAEESEAPSSEDERLRVASKRSQLTTSPRAPFRNGEDEDDETEVDPDELETAMGTGGPSKQADMCYWSCGQAEHEGKCEEL